MKKVLLTTAALMVAIPAAYAQPAADKYGRTYTPQPTASAPAPVASNTTTRSSTVYTDEVDQPLTGAYIGAYGGYGWTDVDTAVGDLSVDGADYGLFAGYQMDRWLQNNMGITGALEGFYGWSEADDEIAGVSVEKDHEWGINFRPGLSFMSMGTSINPYAIVGYRRTTFDASGAVSGEEDFDGLDVGLGTQLISWGDVGLRLDYTHTFYEEKNGLDPDEDDIRVGLSYHF